MEIVANDKNHVTIKFKKREFAILIECIRIAEWEYKFQDEEIITFSEEDIRSLSDGMTMILEELIQH